MQAQECLVRLIVRRPFLVLACSLGIAILLSTVVTAGVLSGRLSLVVDMSPSSFKAVNDPVTDREDVAWLLEYRSCSEPSLAPRCRSSKNESSDSDLKIDESLDEWRIMEHSDPADKISCIFRSTVGQNLLTREGFVRMRDFEESIMSTPFFAANCKRAEGAAAVINAQHQIWRLRWLRDVRLWRDQRRVRC